MTKSIDNVVNGHANFHALSFGILKNVYSPVEVAKLAHSKVTERDAIELRARHTPAARQRGGVPIMSKFCRGLT